MTSIPGASSPLDRRAATALAYAALALSLLEFHGMPWKLAEKGVGAAWFAGRPDLGAGVAWVAATTLLLLVVPLLIQGLFFRASPREVGWSHAGMLRHLPIYVGALAVMLGVVYVMSSQPEFKATYPFVASARRDPSSFRIWESAYLFQFLAVESFFRGYLLFSCERAMGRLAVFVSAVPYTMIHFHKPLPECLGALAAGILLGELALRYRSFYGGVLLHAGVAFAMDYLATRPAG